MLINRYIDKNNLKTFYLYIYTKRQMSKFICQICSSSFIIKSNLTKHVKTKHSDTKNSSNKNKLLNEFEIIGDIEIIEHQSYTQILQAQAIRHFNELQEKDIKIQKLEMEYQAKLMLLNNKLNVT